MHYNETLVEPNLQYILSLYTGEIHYLTELPLPLGYNMEKILYGTSGEGLYQGMKA